MSKKYLVIFSLICLFSFGCAKQQPTQKENLPDIKIVSSSYVPYSLLTNMLDNISLSLLITPGTEAHSFEPNAQNLIDLERADIFFYTSNNTEPWAKNIKKGYALSNNLPILIDGDPHTWLNFDNAIKMLDNIYEILGQKYPSKQEYFAQKYTETKTKINDIKTLFFQ